MFSTSKISDCLCRICLIPTPGEEHSSDPTIEIEIDLTEKDWIDFNLYHQSHAAGAREQRVALYAFVGVLYTPLVLLGKRWFGSRRLKTVVAKGNTADIFGLQKVRLSPDGITVGKTTRLTVPWQEVVKIVETQNALYLYITAQSAAIIPRQSFNDPVVFSDFVNRARAFHTQTPYNKAVPPPPIAAP